jgi:hypothetical protein
MLCEHIEISYEVTNKKVLPFHWTIHTLRCTWCGVKAIVVTREKVVK